MAGPWEKYAEAPKAEPWKRYATPAKPSVWENVWGKGEADTPGERIGQTIGDMGRSLFSGIGRGAANLVALPGMATGLADRAVEKLTGVEVGPSMAERAGVLGQTLYGDTKAGQFQPQTTAGEYAGTVGEFLPGILMGGTAPQMVASGLASEFGGQITEGTKAEPWARLAGAILGPTAANVGGMGVKALVSPGGGAPEAKLRAAASLADEGVNVTAGQKTGNRALQFREEQLGRTMGVMDEQADEFTRAVMKRLDVDGLATPENLKEATKRIGSVFDDVARGRDINFNRAQIRAAEAAVDAYAESVGTVAAMPANIFEKIKSGTITGSEYNDFASRLGKAMTSSDAALRNAAIELRNVLDDGLQASVPASQASRLATARAQYRDLLAIEKAATGAGEAAATGIVTPARLRSAVAAQGRRSYAQGNRDLGELSRAGVIGMSRLPSSGTAERMSAQIARAVGPLAGGGGAGAAIGGMIGGPGGAAIGGGLGLLAPALRNAATASPWGQAYLGNQLMRMPPSTGGSIYAPGLMGMASR